MCLLVQLLTIVNAMQYSLSWDADGRSANRATARLLWNPRPIKTFKNHWSHPERNESSSRPRISVSILYFHHQLDLLRALFIPNFRPKFFISHASHLCFIELIHKKHENLAVKRDSMTDVTLNMSVELYPRGFCIDPYCRSPHCWPLSDLLPTTCCILARCCHLPR